MAVAIVTGASSGIGRSFAKQLKEDYGVSEFWFVARRKEKMEALRDELSAPCKIICADLTTPEGIGEVKRALAEEKPEVSHLVNAAGFGKFGSFGQVSEEDVIRMIDLNDKALVLLTHAVIPYMIPGGRIIEMGSGSCFTPLPNFNVYASTKAFVLHYTKALNYEIRGRGLRATCFCPGWVDTEFLGLATSVPGAYVPKSVKPLLNADKVVKKALRASARGRVMCVTNWYTKLQHLLFKLLPDGILTRTWMKMQTKNDSGERDPS